MTAFLACRAAGKAVRPKHKCLTQHPNPTAPLDGFVGHLRTNRSVRFSRTKDGPYVDVTVVACIRKQILFLGHRHADPGGLAVCLATVQHTHDPDHCRLDLQMHAPATYPEPELGLFGPTEPLEICMTDRNVTLNSLLHSLLVAFVQLRKIGLRLPCPLDDLQWDGSYRRPSSRMTSS